MKILKKCALGLLVAALAVAGLVNVQTLAANVVVVEGPESEAPTYGMKHVANGVFHCTSGGATGCDTPSSHVWLE